MKATLQFLLIFSLCLVFNTLSAQSPGGASNLQVWLKANTGVTGTATVTNWADQSGNGYDIAQNGSNALPSLNNGVSNTFNYNPFLEFNTSDKQLYRNSFFGINEGAEDAGDDVTVFAVARPTASNSFKTILEFGGSGGGFDDESPFMGIINGNVALQTPFSEGNNIVNGTTVNLDATAIFGYTWNDSASGGDADIEMMYNGIDTPDVSNNALTNAQGEILSIGAGTSFNEGWRGDIAEVIIFNVKVSAQERLNIESYLAIKYGITLDQVAATNYSASDNTVIWNATTNTSYNNDIAGIGRDDVSQLNQKQSTSLNTDAIVSIGLGSIEASNVANTNTFSADKNFLIWGNDNGSIGLQSSELPAGANALYRMGREWKVAETGTISNLTIAFTGNYGTATDIELYIDTDGDGDFTDATVITGGSFANGKVTFTGVNLNNNDVFTLGLSKPSPANNNNDLVLWMRADKSITLSGTDVTAWEDYSGGDYLFDDGEVARYPTINNSGINYNPTLTYTDGDELVNNDNLKLIPENTQELSVFAVALPTNNETIFLDAQFENLGTDDGWIFGRGGEFAGSNSLALGIADGTNKNNGNIAKTANNTHLVNTTGIFYASHGATNTDASFYVNGQNIATTQDKTSGTLKYDPTHTATRIGRDNDGFDPNFVGEFAELIVFKKTLSDSERQSIESYLAIKYGITLDQTIATNYTASDNTVIWNATTNAAYNNDIAGIGRDDISELNQKQTTSSNVDGIVSIGLGGIEASNTSNTNTFSADKSFLIWGNDNGSTGLQSSELPASASAHYRMGREWKVAETGAISNLTIAFTGSYETAMDIELYIDTDGDGNFANATVVTGGTIVDGKATFTGINLNNGDLFTLGYSIPTPGGAFNNLQVWLKSNYGVTGAATVTNWADQSGNGYDVAQNGSNAVPSLNNGASNTFNYNPFLEFNSSDKQLYRNSFFGINEGAEDAGDDVTVFAVARPTASNAFKTIVEFGGNDEESPFIGIVNGNAALQTPVADGNNTVSGTAVTLNTTAIFGYTWNDSTTGGDADIEIMYNGIDTPDASNNALTEAQGDELAIGAGTNFNEGWRGDIAEVIIFNAKVTAQERQNIESYLAIKYGITLDQTVATNYTASDNTVIWNATNNASYNTAIFGIGEDTNSALDQKVARSANDANGPILATTQHFTEVNEDAARTTSLGNGNFMLMGHDNAANSFTGSYNGGTDNRLARIWKVSETGTVGAIYFAIPKASYMFPSGTPSIVISNDTTFDNTDTLVTLNDDGTFYWAQINPTNNQFITVASESTLGIDKKDILVFTMYPNPTRNKLNLVFNNSENHAVNVKIHNALGQQILNTKKEIVNNRISLDIINYTTGVYLVTIKTKDKIDTKRLIIKN
jgi:hypothetical protein